MLINFVFLTLVYSELRDALGFYCYLSFDLMVTKMYEIRDSYKLIKRIFDLASRTGLEDSLLPPSFFVINFFVLKGFYGQIQNLRPLM